MPIKAKYIEIARALIMQDLSDDEVDAKVDEIDRYWIAMTRDERNEVEHVVMGIVGDSMSTAAVAQE